MNILGFISFFLLLFAFICASFSADSRNFQKQVHEQLTQHLLAKKTYQKLHTKHFSTLQAKSPKKKQEDAVEKKKAEKEKWKTEKYPSCAKCNILLLLNDPCSCLKPVVTNLIHELLQQTARQYTKPLNTKNFVEEFLQKMKEQKQKKEAFFLEKLLWKAPKKQQQYYFLLRQIPQSACLLDLLHTNPKQKTICVACCSEEMLIALFGQSIAKKIVQKKTDPLHQNGCTKKEFESLLTQEGRTLHPDLWKYLRFTHNTRKETSITITAKKGDKQSKVVVPKSL